SPPYSDGRFSNGPVWVQDLASQLGLPALTASLAGGTDFAVGGAQTGTTPVHTANLSDLPAQLAAFQTAVPTPASGALYTLWIGANDLFSILGTPGISQATAIADANAAVSNVVTFVAGLAADGAKTLLLVTVPNLGVVPAITKLGSAAETAATDLSAYFDQALVSAVGGEAAGAGMHLSILDSFGLLDDAIADPAAFGFSNVTTPCWTGNYTSASSGTRCASTIAGQDQYLFWDQVHPTAAGQQIIADAAFAEVPEPGSLALLLGGLGALGFVRRRRAAPTA
ncbi:MAG: SGNH/GDSL hydrolase family protein, partial [Acidibrevibacterium sp.]|uniref:SGNH/GDSL hydrolase family protein n=1 Tax=Acidibrevibacterium sp. TaxID=2606776 RepID=UPI003D039145